MPRGDNTGPQGGGRMTGRRLGACANNNQGEFEPGFGAGFGRGRQAGASQGRRGGGGQGFGQRNGQGLGYRSQASITNNEVSGLGQQLTTMIDQLSKLLQQTSSPQVSDHEKG